MIDEINKINYPENDLTKKYILENTKIEDKLHVIAVVSNPCNFKIRYKLTNEFIERMNNEPDIILYVVELVYGSQPYMITDPSNNKHLQIRTNSPPLWHKENMINMGIKYLLPSDWKAVAWIDADIEFESPHWAIDTLKILNGYNDFVQLFIQCIDMDHRNQFLRTHTGFGYQYSKKFIRGEGFRYWHPGYAWACNRKAYDKIGGLMDLCIIGSADLLICNSFLKQATHHYYLKKGMNEEYIKYIEDYQKNFEGLKIGYIPGTIRHYFHGTKKNRNYQEREDILINHQFNPYTFLKKHESGLVIPNKDCPIEFIADIQLYFIERNEDEMVLEAEKD